MPRSTSTYAAQAASAFETESRTILTTSPVGPEKAAIARALQAGWRAGGGGGAGRVSGDAVRGRGAGAGRRGRPEGRPRRVPGLADLVGDRAGRGPEGDRGPRRAR